MTSITSTTVFVDARVSALTSTSRHCFYRLTGAQGLRFRVAIGLRSNWSDPELAGWYRLVWTTDPTGNSWRFFDHTIIEGDYWVGVNANAFVDDVIYVASLPIYTLTRSQQKMDEWILNEHTRPTASGDSSYVIGTLSAVVGPTGKNLPETDLRAMSVGTGSKHVALTAGLHPLELGEWFLEAAVEKILEETPTGEALREEFTFHVYPSINAHGAFSGEARLDPETGLDANRNWGESSTAQLKVIYEGAWATDFTQLKAHIDYHSAPGQDVDSDLRELWRKAVGEPLNADYIAALAARTTFREVDGTLTNAIRPYISDTYGTLVSVVPEHTHSIQAKIEDWYQWGRDSILALLDIADADWS